MTRRGGLRRFAVVQHPISDLRPLVRSPTWQLTRPSWPDPVPGREFVRGAGMIRDRPRGTIRDWSGERAFCDARGLLRVFPETWPYLATYPAAEAYRCKLTLTQQYRRLYCTHVAHRVDVAAHVRTVRPWTSAHDWEPAVLGMWVQVTGSDRSLPLADAGPTLAARLAHSTTKFGERAPVELLDAGTPMLLVEVHTRRERPASMVSAPDATFAGDSIWFRGRRVPRWTVTFNPHCEANRARQIRGHIWRLHAEREALRNVLRAWRRDPGQFDRAELREYLIRQLQLLAKERRYGVEQGPLLRHAQQIESLAPPEVVDDLRMELLAESRGVARLLDRTIERSQTISEAQSVLIRVEQGGRLVMREGDSYTVHGSAYGSAFGPHAQAHSGDITVDSAKVEAQLKLLAGVLAPLLVDMSRADRVALTEAHRQLEQAATTGKPDRGRLKTAAERFGRMARKAGEISAPVTEALNNLLKLFGVA